MGALDGPWGSINGTRFVNAQVFSWVNLPEHFEPVLKV